MDASHRSPSPLDAPTDPEPQRRRLPVVEPFVDCLRDAKTCEHTGCRMHLGGVRELDGRAWRCAVDVATSYPGGLPPFAVGALLGMTEGEVLRVERTMARKHPLAFRRLRRQRLPWTE